MLCARRCCTMSYVLVQAPQEIWWLMSFDVWAVSVFLWGQWHRLRLLLGFYIIYLGSFVCFVDSCVVFWKTQDWFAQFEFMRSLIVLWTFQGTRFTCDDFSWGVECYLWLLQGISAQGGVCCIVFRNLFTCCTMEGVLTDYGVPTVLDVAHLQLYFVSAKKESCLPLYIVPGSHRIDERERVSPYW
jgi:hypothetical protein